MVLDLDLWLRVGRLGPLVYVPQRWAAFREHSSSKTIAQQARAAPETVAMNAYVKSLVYPPNPFYDRTNKPTNPTIGAGLALFYAEWVVS